MTRTENFKDVFGVKPSELAIKKLNEFIAYYEQLDLDIESEEDDKTNEADCLDAFRYALNAIETNDKWEEAIKKIKADINDGINETASLIEVAKVNTNFFAEEELGRLKSILNNVQEVIDKHTKELTK